MRDSGGIREELGDIPRQMEEAAGRGDFAGVHQLKVRAQELQRECLEACAQEAEQLVTEFIREESRCHKARETVRVRVEKAREALQKAQTELTAVTNEQSMLGVSSQQALGEARNALAVALACRRAIDEHSQLVAVEVMERDPDPGLKARVHAAIRGQAHEDYLKGFGHTTTRFNGAFHAMRSTSIGAAEVLEKLLEAGEDLALSG